MGGYLRKVLGIRKNEQIKVEKNIGGMGGLCVVEPVDHGDAVAISWRPTTKKI